MANRRPIVLIGGQPVELSPADTFVVGPLSATTGTFSGPVTLQSALTGISATFSAGGSFGGNLTVTGGGSFGSLIGAPGGYFTGDVYVMRGTSGQSQIVFGDGSDGRAFYSDPGRVILTPGPNGLFELRGNMTLSGALTGVSATFSAGGSFGGNLTVTGAASAASLSVGSNLAVGGSISFGARGQLQIDDNGTYLDAKYQHVLRTTATGSNVVVASLRPDTSTINSNLTVAGPMFSASGSQVRGVNGAATYSGWLAPGIQEWSAGVEASSSANNAKFMIGTGTGLGQVQFALGTSGIIYAFNNILPTNDNSATLGDSGHRFSVVYAGSGTINTSDATQKTVRTAGPTDAERSWAAAIVALPYQFNDAIAEKGEDAARMHWGVLAQDVYAAGIAAGIDDPFHHAFLCRDRKMTTDKRMVPVERQVTETATVDQITVQIIEGRAVQVVEPVEEERPLVQSLPLFDANGEPVMETVPDPDAPEGEPPATIERQVMHPAAVMEAVPVDQTFDVPAFDADGQPEWIWGVRYTELIMFLIACGRFG